jgi:phenylalanyl-tRNA synthetase alpha chain
LLASARTAAAQAPDPDALEAARLTYLGRKEGSLTLLLRSLPALSPDEKRRLGRRANEVKTEVETLFAARQKELESSRLDAALRADAPDLSLPGAPLSRGKRHPLLKTLDAMTAVFESLGFTVTEGPEVEDDAHNFTALNHPPDHPARDAHDTFYLKNFRDTSGAPLLLRTHTSPVQVRWMENHKPPFSIISSGRVFRHEAVDATHGFVFHQLEGLAVGADVSMADLKGVLARFAGRIFGLGAEIRFRPSYFPFVEPGIEVDVSCAFCRGKGCRVCKMSGWVEMLGAGMVHPNVFRNLGWDPDAVRGYAFGIGVERVAMFQYGVDDMRLFYENDRRFLDMFP